MGQEGFSGQWPSGEKHRRRLIGQVYRMEQEGSDWSIVSRDLTKEGPDWSIVSRDGTGGG